MLGSASKIKTGHVRPAFTSAGAAVPRCLTFQQQMGQRKGARTADAHLHDGYSNSQVIKDGYSWCPLSIAERNHRNQEGEVFAGPKVTR